MTPLIGFLTVLLTVALVVLVIAGAVGFYMWLSDRAMERARLAQLSQANLLRMKSQLDVDAYSAGKALIQESLRHGQRNTSGR